MEKKQEGQSRYPCGGDPNEGKPYANQKWDFSFLTTHRNCVPDLSAVTVHTQTLPRYVYSKEGRRQSNINLLAIAAFNSTLGLDIADDFVDADSLFYYVYGYLHLEEWRKKWEVTLRKEAARIDLPKSLEEFQRIAKLGKELANLHLDYENCPPLELEIEKADDFDERNPECFEVEKMKWGGKRPNLDKTILHYNQWLTIRGIPLECHNYRLGARSALDWIVDRYKVKTDKRSQITRNPNRWNAGNGLSAGQYIFNLIPRICNLSLKTNQIQNRLLSTQ